MLVLTYIPLGFANASYFEDVFKYTSAIEIYEISPRGFFYPPLNIKFKIGFQDFSANWLFHFPLTGWKSVQIYSKILSLHNFVSDAIFDDSL